MAIIVDQNNLENRCSLQKNPLYKVHFIYNNIQIILTDMTYSESTFSWIHWSIIVLNMEHDPITIGKFRYEKNIEIILESITKEHSSTSQMLNKTFHKSYAVLQW